VDNSSSIALDIQQLSNEIHLAVKTIRTTLVKNPGALPPRLIIEGQKRLLWLRSDVIDFYNRQKRSHGSNPDFSTKPFKPSLAIEPTLNARRKRGAPTNSEKLAKKMAVR